MRVFTAGFLLTLAFTAIAGQQPATQPFPEQTKASQSAEHDSKRAALIARAKSLELDTPYVPPGNPNGHYAHLDSRRVNSQ